MQNTITQQMVDNFDLLKNLISLRLEKDKSKLNNIKYNIALSGAINKFSYIVDNNTSKYKHYQNYEDLKQEGLMGLVTALEKFDPERSKNFFKLANWYIRTKIKRAANKHNTINVPMKLADKIHFIKTTEQPILVDKQNTPLESFEFEKTCKVLDKCIQCLSEMQKKVLYMYYGIESDTIEFDETDESIGYISKSLKISRVNTKKLLK